MAPDAHAPRIPPRRPRLRLAVKIAVAACLALVLALLLGVGVPVLREFTRPIAPPNFMPATDSLLAPDDSPSVVSDLPQDPENNPDATPVSQLVATSASTSVSSTSASSATFTLRFKPFIPGVPDLPTKLRPIQSTLNARFDRLLCDVEDYERIKDGLSYEQARQRLDNITKTKNEIWSRIVEANGPSFPMKGWTGEVFKRFDGFTRWRYLAEAEVNVKGGKWLEAASWCDRILNMNRMDWSSRSILSAPDRPVFMSDYYRQANSLEWDCMIGCYRQIGGVDGYAHIASAVLGRQKEKFRDALGRAEWRMRTALRRR